MEDDLDSLLVPLRATLEACAPGASELATKGVCSLQKRLLDPSVGSRHALRGRILNIVCSVTGEMGAVGQKVCSATLENIRSLHVISIGKALAVHLEELLCVADPLDTFLRSGAAHFPNLEPVLWDFGLVDDVLLAVGVFEPCGVNDARRRSVALYKVVLGVVYARDIVADGSSDAVLDAIRANGLLVERREVPNMV